MSILFKGWSLSTAMSAKSTRWTNESASSNTCSALCLSNKSSLTSKQRSQEFPAGSTVTCRQTQTTQWVLACRLAHVYACMYICRDTHKSAAVNTNTVGRTLNCNSQSNSAPCRSGPITDTCLQKNLTVCSRYLLKQQPFSDPVNVLSVLTVQISWLWTWSTLGATSDSSMTESISFSSSYSNDVWQMSKARVRVFKASRGERRKTAEKLSGANQERTVGISVELEGHAAEHSCIVMKLLCHSLHH